MELRELYKELEEFNESYRTRLKSEMARILQECGLGADVEYDGKVGAICVEINTYDRTSMEYKFYSYKKDGGLCQKSTYVRGISYFLNDSNDKIKEQLLNKFKPHVKEDK